MKVVNETWGDIPLLHVFDEEKATPDTPIVLFIHGFESAKEHNLHYAYNLVQQGVRVLLPDAMLHGERGQNLSVVELSARFWEVVLTNIQEVKKIYEALSERGFTGRFGLAGTSMGGITTLGCLKVYDFIETAAVYMGTPSYIRLAEGQLAQMKEQGFDVPLSDEDQQKLMATLRYFDLSEEPEKLNLRPVYFWHGKLDKTVPFGLTYPVYEQKIKPLYADVPERLQFDVAKHDGHKVNRAGMLAGTAWLADHLR
ncbi:esterase [Kurthia senegalensis]|uniref:esterase n=1 Tax=Kurthia senegalensis TaxID=1033740 RepID=UPI000289139A|nr:esterase [Kurthia senegalensis]